MYLILFVIHRQSRFATLCSVSSVMWLQAVTKTNSGWLKNTLGWLQLLPIWWQEQLEITRSSGSRVGLLEEKKNLCYLWTFSVKTNMCFNKLFWYSINNLYLLIMFFFFFLHWSTYGLYVKQWYSAWGVQ